MIQWFARNGIAANLLMIGILLGGLYCAFYRITLEKELDRSYGSVYFSKFYPGATPRDVQNEILIPVARADGSRKVLACGSINLHGNFFGTRFEIVGAEGEPASTGCVGLGIERWVLACFSQHGLDPDRWPAAVRERIF